MDIEISCKGHCEKLSHFLDIVSHTVITSVPNHLDCTGTFTAYMSAFEVHTDYVLSAEQEYCNHYSFHILRDPIVHVHNRQLCPVDIADIIFNLDPILSREFGLSASTVSFLPRSKSGWGTLCRTWKSPSFRICCMRIFTDRVCLISPSLQIVALFLDHLLNSIVYLNILSAYI